MKSTFKTIGRIVIILAVAGLIIATLSALNSAAGGGTAMQPPAREMNFARDAPLEGRERGAGGANAFGLLELVKNMAVMGLIISAYWFGQNWFSRRKRANRIAA